VLVYIVVLNLFVKKAIMVKIHQNLEEAAPSES
jgi:hypothetical protein